jgi:hypothetical protein
MTLLGLTWQQSKPAYDGTGIGVAIIDSGITANQDFMNFLIFGRVV